MRRIFLLFFLLGPVLALAHIGSPDVYLDAQAGPYQLFVTVRPPVVIPGVAEIEVRASAAGVREMTAVPMPMAGPGAKYTPVADRLTVSKQDPQLFTGALWLMQPGSWQVRITATGGRGQGKISIPLPSAALRTKRMPAGLGVLLALLGLFLVGGLAAMVGASVREARLEPGMVPSKARVRAGRIATAIAFALTLAFVWLGNRWWTSAATSYDQKVYKPLRMQATLSRPAQLTLRLTDPGWLNSRAWATVFSRSVDDFIPDHGHLMHLYLIRQPGLDVVYHLHPKPKDPGVFELSLPSMPAGNYKLYADVVHANGFPETLVSSIHLDALNGRALSGDDARGSGPTWQAAGPNTTEFTLPDGYKMVWLPVPQGLHPRKPILFRFRLEKPNGSAPPDMAFYMGMLGHAAFVKTDGSVFAHVHPTGSVSMAALMLAQKEDAPARQDNMEGMDMSGEKTAVLPNEVTIPFGFPSTGQYRIFIQMKHGDVIETAMFDAAVR